MSRCSTNNYISSWWLGENIIYHTNTFYIQKPHTKISLSSHEHQFGMYDKILFVFTLKRLYPFTSTKLELTQTCTSWAYSVQMIFPLTLQIYISGNKRISTLFCFCKGQGCLVLDKGTNFEPGLFMLYLYDIVKKNSYLALFLSSVQWEKLEAKLILVSFFQACTKSI